ncbi:uncharacterized protein [Henckelia pumila]|uniref:uncharacterized protein n=1 Tax=Henckelia pumila TaxID=405737 RepID=UPI003C6DBFAB
MVERGRATWADFRDAFSELYFPPALCQCRKIADTVKIHGVTEDTIRLQLFPFSLLDNARSWLQSLPLGSITIWIELFYNGLNGPTRISMDIAAGGSIFSKFHVDAYEILEQITINSYQWLSEISLIKKPAGIHEFDAFTTLNAQMTVVSTQLAAISKGNQVSTQSASLATAVNPTDGFESVEQAQYVNNQNFNGYRGNPVPNQYHHSLRNHDNFSYANNNNVLNPPPRFNNKRGEGKPSLKDLVSNFISESTKIFERNENRLDNMETHLTNVGASMKNLETQIDQFANALTKQQIGAFISNTEVNPIEHCKVITLKSGKEVGIVNPTVEETKVEAKKTKVDDISEPAIVYEKPPVPKPVLPYPQWFKKRTLDEQFFKFLDIFKKIHTKIPFTDTLEQMHNYAKFLKDVMFRKQNLEEYETVKLTVECSVILQKKSLELGEVKPTTIALQLADRSLVYPHGVVEDATAEAKIYVKRGEPTMELEGEKTIFTVFKEASKPPKENVFMVEQIKKVEQCGKIESKLELKIGQDPKVAKNVKKKSKSKIIIEYVWRVKERNNTSNKVAVMG